MRDVLHDRTVSFLARPYHFIEDECRRRGSHVFETRLLFEKTVCLMGAEAAKAFYSEFHLQRKDAAPEPVQATLFGKGGLQQLDGSAHHARKALFLSILAPENAGRLARRVRRYWGGYERWSPPRYRLPLYETAQHVLALSVCEWLGVPVRGGDLASMSADLSALFNDAGGAGHLKARRARSRLERWLAGLVEEARSTPGRPAVGPLFHAVATFPDFDSGKLLPPRIAAVEVLNLMRPVVAVSVYIVWMAHALLCHPGLRRDLVQADARLRKAFVEEVRRFYPFFPALMARVAEPFSWRSQPFEVGDRVLLDIHGTNHDPRHWHEPGEFRPERFLREAIDPYAFIPQGAGDPLQGHRCPGEGATVGIMVATLDFLLRHLPHGPSRWSPEIAEHRLPALPAQRIYIG